MPSPIINLSALEPLYLPTEKELKEELEREKRMLEMELNLLKSKGKRV